MSVLALVEHEGGQVDELSLQALSLARELAGGEPLTALLVGEGGREASALSDRSSRRVRPAARRSTIRTPPMSTIGHSATEGVSVVLRPRRPGPGRAA